MDSGDYSWLNIENKFLAYMKELAVTQIYLMCLYWFRFSTRTGSSRPQVNSTADMCGMNLKCLKDDCDTDDSYRYNTQHGHHGEGPQPVWQW